MNKIIAIDGPTASGKGTLAKKISQHFNLPYLNTGGLYRAVALKIIKDNNADFKDKSEVIRILGSVDFSNLDNPELYVEDVGTVASKVSVIQEVRDFLYSDTKLNSFFDVHDILDGYKFGDQITTKIGSCSLLILFTDTYSSREWCRKEALIAKDKHIPIVAVFMLDGNVDRVFPYIGNVPSTVFDGDWRKVINLLLRTMLDQSVEAVMLEEDCDENTEFLPYPPEAYNMSLLKDETRKLLYPEPPLGNEELDVLKHICEKMHRNIVFCTPMSHLTENINLGQKNIAISISEYWLSPTCICSSGFIFNSSSAFLYKFPLLLFKR